MSGHDTAAGRLGPGASWYASQGWEVFPVWGIVGGKCACGTSHPEPKDHGKHPHGGLVADGMKQASTDASIVSAWWAADAEANIGVRCRESGFLVVDVDPRSKGDESWLKLEEILEGDLPRTVTAETGFYTGPRGSQRGRHYFYRCSPGEVFKANLNKDKLPGIDVKHNGYVLISPSRHMSGTCYDWVPGHAPWEIEMAEAPEALLNFLRKRAPRSATGKDASFLGDMEYGGKKVDLDALLTEGIGDGSRNVELHRIACAQANRQKDIKTESGAKAVQAFMMMVNHEHVVPPLPHDELMSLTNKAIRMVRERPVDELIFPGITEWRDTMEIAERGDLGGSGGVVEGELVPAAGSVEIDPIRAAVEYEMPVDFPLPSTMPADQDAVDSAQGGTIGQRSLTDMGNSRRIIDYAGERLRYTEGIGWFVWNGSYWVPDTGRIMLQEIVKQLPVWVASESSRHPDPIDAVQWAQKCRSVGSRNAAMEDAKSDLRTVRPVETWDSNTDLLGVKNGVIDLRTGSLLPPHPDLHITKRAKVAYTPGMTHPLWSEFLNQVTGGDKEYELWLQKAAGYTLTGRRTFDVLFIVFGPPGSGKSTFLEALGHMLGDYMWPMSSTVLLDDGGRASSSDEYHWAQLRGRRMVTISELPEGKRTKEDAIKRLTGDMTISARSPGEQPFQFESQAKLWIGTNHKPQVQDEAMWRRIRAIPFEHVPEKPNPDLKAMLMDPEGALPAALAWAVEGAVRLLNSGDRDALGWCGAVQRASEEYRKQEDRLGMFLDEELREGDGLSIPMKEVYMIYKVWAEDRGEKPMTTIALTRKLMERGMKLDAIKTTGRLLGWAAQPRAVVDSGFNWEAVTRFAR